jgi:hypothetical protein
VLDVDVATTAVWAEVADDEPPEFVAVTITRSVAPASVVWSTYELLVAALMFAQLAPNESQSSHW